MCYLLMPDPRTFEDAKQHCMQYGVINGSSNIATLASVDGIEYQAFVTRKLSFYFHATKYGTKLSSFSHFVFVRISPVD